MPEVESKVRPRVLMTTVSVGAGHKSVAGAIIDALNAGGSDIEVECVDVLAKYTSRLFRAYYSGGFATGMSKLPALYGLGYRLKDRPQGSRRGLDERRRLWSERLVLRKFLDDLERHPPTLIVNTHFLPPPAVGWLIEQGRLKCPQFVVITDIQVHRFWYSENVAHWFAPNEYAAAPLRRWGIPESQITVAGIPVRPKWTAPLDRAKVLSEWNLPADRPIVVLTAGTEFLCGPVMRIARWLLDACPRMHLVTLTGRQEKTRQRMSQLPEAAPGGRLTVVPFTDRVNELVRVSSLMVTKAGGVTVAECLASGTPMVLLRPVPGHEAGNAYYVEHKGAGVVANSSRGIIEVVRSLLSDEPRRAVMSQAARNLYKPSAELIASAIRQCVTGA